MERRKIQLIAGSTYTISLPKEWVVKNKLKEKNEILIYEKGDRTLMLSPHSMESKKLEDISLNIDDHLSEINQVLFALYYLGIENISLFSKNDIAKEIRTRIIKTITNMSVTEVSYEDAKNIKIKVLLDKSKVEIPQVIYRIGLIIGLSVANLLDGFDITEVRINENEIDRLYHLISKIVSLSLIDSNILKSSKIDNVIFIPSYFLIGKRLENLGDNIYYLSEYIEKNNANFESRKEILNFVRADINRIARYTSGDFHNMFEKTGSEDLKKISSLVLRIKDKTVSDYLRQVMRYLIDIEEEIFIISFYNSLIKSGAI